MGRNRRIDDVARRWPRLLTLAVLGTLVAVTVGVVGAQAERAGATVTPAPPVIGSSAVSPSVVPAGSLVTFTWKVVSQAGVGSTSLFTEGLDLSPLGNCDGAASLVAGTEKSGTYQQLCTVPLVVADTTWSTVIIAQDTNGQESEIPGPSFTTAGGQTPPPPPQISSASVRPASVRAGGKVTFTWKVAAPGIVASTSAGANGPDGTQLSNCYGPATLVSGTPTAGTYRQVCVVPKAVDNGTWTTFLSAGDLDDSGAGVQGPSFTVHGGTGSVPPAIGAATVAPSVVATGGHVVFTWQASSPEGVEFTALDAQGPGILSTSACDGEGVLIAGTPLAGTYEEACTIPIGSPTGTWSTFITVEDTGGGAAFVPGPSFTVEPIVITTATLPAGTVHQLYAADLAAVGGTPPYRWSVTAGTLPPGLRLRATGTIAGRPTASGLYSFTVGLVDRASGKPPTHNAASASLSISVAPRAGALSIAPTTGRDRHRRLR